jgi:hypothetical protein
MTIPEMDDLGPSCLAGSWAMFAVTSVFVALRLYCRQFHGARQLALDDYLTLFVMFIFCLSVIITNISINYGLGKKFAVVDSQDAESALYWLVMANSVGIWSFSLPKLAIVALIQRILRIRAASWTGVILWGLAIISQMTIFVVSVLWYKQCDPVEYQWNRSLDGSCPGNDMLMSWGYASSSYSAFLDVFFALYPIPAVMQLKMPLRNRISVSAALGLTSIGCAVSVYKIIELVDVLPTLATDPLRETSSPFLLQVFLCEPPSRLTENKIDPMPYLMLLVFVESMVLITCASIPALGPLVRQLQGKVNSYRERSSRRTGEGGTGLKSASRTPYSGSNNEPTLVTIGGRSWKNGQKAKRVRSDGTTLDLSPVGSSDEIPLAQVDSIPRPHSEPESYSGDGIQKTTKISVSSERGSTVDVEEVGRAM